MAHLINPPKNKCPQADWHEDFVVYTAWLLRPKIYVELGVETCRVFNRILPFVEQAYACDIDCKCKLFLKKDPKVNFFNMKTVDFAQYLKKHPISIDLLFIDADHAEMSAKKDFQKFCPFVSDQGIILMHDSYPLSSDHTNPYSSGTVYKAVWELSQQQKDYEMMTIPLAPGLTLCRKRKYQVPWKKSM